MKSMIGLIRHLVFTSALCDACIAYALELESISSRRANPSVAMPEPDNFSQTQLRLATLFEQTSEKSLSSQTSAMFRTNVFDLTLLSTPRSPHEFVSLLNTISENFLLLDPRFQRNELLMSLFDAKAVSNPYSSYPQLSSLGMREFELSEDSLLKVNFKINNIAFSFLRDQDLSKEKSLSALSFVTTSSDNFFTADLIELQLGSGGVWVDPLGGINAFSTPESVIAAARRSPTTHPKGYYLAQFFHESAVARSEISFEFNQNGTLRSAQIKQRGK